MTGLRARRFAALLLFVSGTLCLGGCLRSQEEIRLESDGSGTVRQTWRIDVAGRQRLLAIVVEAFGGEDARGPAVLPQPFAPSWLERLARAVRGFEIQRSEERTEEGEIIVEHEARFEDLKAAARAGVFFSASIELERADGGTWRLTCREAVSSVAAKPDGEVAGRPYRQLVGLLQPGLDGLSFERTLVFPTRVVETSGELAEDGRTVRWHVDLADLEAGRDLTLTVRFAQDETLELERLRHRVDGETLAERLSGPPPGTKDEMPR